MIVLALRVSLVFGIAGCSGPKPILYPNTHYQQVGLETAESDIAACKELAKESGATPSQGKGGQVAGSTAGGAVIGSASGAVGGAVFGNPGRGAAVGAASGATAGLLRGLFRRSPPSQAYMQFVSRCLKERGYEPMGWE
ncbi:MAG: glycine zipper family protein [Nitrospiraceae bacterium]